MRDALAAHEKRERRKDAALQLDYQRQQQTQETLFEQAQRERERGELLMAQLEKMREAERQREEKKRERKERRITMLREKSPRITSPRLQANAGRPPSPQLRPQRAPSPLAGRRRSDAGGIAAQSSFSKPGLTLQVRCSFLLFASFFCLLIYSFVASFVCLTVQVREKTAFMTDDDTATAGLTSASAGQSFSESDLDAGAATTRTQCSYVAGSFEEALSPPSSPELASSAPYTAGGPGGIDFGFLDDTPSEGSESELMRRRDGAEDAAQRERAAEGGGGGGKGGGRGCATSGDEMPMHHRQRGTLRAFAIASSTLGEFLCTVTFYANLAHSLTRSP
jgi:hypothetical protein